MSKRVVIGVDFAHGADFTSVAVFTNGNLNTARPSWATMSAAEMVADLESMVATYRRPRRPWSKALMRERLNRATRESRKSRAAHMNVPPPPPPEDSGLALADRQRETQRRP